jgi:nucleoside-triphosphate--adenylate kinase
MTVAGKIIRALILGAPGSGKGTISSRLVNDFQLKHLASGDILRNQISAKTDVGKEAESIMVQGHLVPDELMVKLMDQELSTLHHSWLLDGYPRTLLQAKALSASQPIDIVVNLDVPFDVIRQRLENRWIHKPSGRVYHTEWSPPKVPGVDDETGEELIQRDDDKPETVQWRLKLYDNMTKPLLEYYKNLGLLHSFSGNESNIIYPKIKYCLQDFVQEGSVKK